MRSFAVVALLLVACKGSGSSPETGRSAPASPAAQTIPGVELAALAGAGTVPYQAGAPLLVVAPGGIDLAGTRVIAMHDGVVDPADKEGGALGLKIPRLTAALASAGAPDGELDVALDRRLTYGLLMEVLFSAKQKEAGRVRFKILARAGGEMVAIPITLPSKAPTAVDAGSLGGQLGGIKKEEPSLGSETVLGTIQASYMKGITGCYKDLLRSHPKAGGSLQLSLSVTAEGGVDHPSAHGIGSGLEACVEKAMKAWVFPIPRDEQGNPTDVPFRLTLTFVPEGEAKEPLSAPETELAALAAPSLASSDEMPVKLCVSVTDTELILWSFTGMEGTLKEPKLRVARSKPTAVAELGQALAEIVSRRWGDRARPETSHDIVVMADGPTTIQAITEIFAAVRATADGKELFRDILLSSGFE